MIDDPEFTNRKTISDRRVLSLELCPLALLFVLVLFTDNLPHWLELVLNCISTAHQMV